MRIEDIFTPDELQLYSATLDEARSGAGYEPGRWKVSNLNRSLGRDNGSFPRKVIVRDITLRTIEQTPGVVLTPDQRREYLRALARAGVPSIVLTAFRRGHTLDEIREDVQAVREIAPECELVIGNAVSREEMEFAKEAGVDAVQVWSAFYLGKAMPVSAGAVYHRVWQDRDWHNLNFPTDVNGHIDRSRRLLRAARDVGVKASGTVNLLHLATEEYVEEYSRAAAEEGAYEIDLADSAAGTAPEAVARFVEVAKAAAPQCEIGIHAHNLYGMGIATSVAAARAGAEMVEVAVNGFEVGPAGCQASLAGTAAALEVLYGVDTGIDLSQMMGLSEIASKLMGIEIPWNEPVVGWGIFEGAGADEYEMEADFDRLIHASIEPAVVGGRRVRRVGVTTGPLGMWQMLRELGVAAEKEDIEPILRACLDESLARGSVLSDDEVRVTAESVLAGHSSERDS